MCPQQVMKPKNLLGSDHLLSTTDGLCFYRLSLDFFARFSSINTTCSTVENVLIFHEMLDFSVNGHSTVLGRAQQNNP